MEKSFNVHENRKQCEIQLIKNDKVTIKDELLLLAFIVV